MQQKQFLVNQLLNKVTRLDLQSLRTGVYVKVPVFSFAKLRRVDITLGPEMKSTGEVMGKDITLEKALYKGLVAAGMEIKEYGSVLMTVSDKDKEEMVQNCKTLYEYWLSHCGNRRYSKSDLKKQEYELKWSIKLVQKVQHYLM